MKSKPSFTKAEAEEIVRLIKKKLKADSSTQKRIRSKIRNIGFYASDYGFRDGYTAEQFLSVAKITDASNSPSLTITMENVNVPVKQTLLQANFRNRSDESYIIDLCDKVLNQKALRQHRFDFLKGDSGTKLPVDAYYPSLNLVVEYKEKQHSEEVKFFDKRQTISGIGRGEQRRLYDQRRRDVLPKQGIKMIELDYTDFEYTKSKKLVRKTEQDMKVLIEKLKDFQ